MQGSSIVKLNVGGSKFQTTLETLSLRGPNMLSKLVERNLDGSFKAMLDDKGFIFIDRHGPTFEVWLVVFLSCFKHLMKYVLEFLRTGKVWTRKDVPVDKLYGSFTLPISERQKKKKKKPEIHNINPNKHTKLPKIRGIRLFCYSPSSTLNRVQRNSHTLRGVERTGNF